MTWLSAKATAGLLVLCLASAIACGGDGASTPEQATSPPPQAGQSLPGMLVFTRAGGEYGDETVFVSQAGTETQLGPKGGTCCPRVTPDGRTMLMAANEGSRVTVALVGVDGAGYRKLALPDATLNLGPGAWSPDGRVIAFEGWDDATAGRTGIYLGPVDGDERQRLTDAGAEHDIPGDFSPDGHRLTFLRQDPGGPNPGRLFVVDVTGGNVRPVTPVSLQVQCCGNYRWSPDGTRIVFADTRGNLWTVQPDGRQLRRIYRAGVGRYAITPAWSPDGHDVIFALDPSPDPFAHPVNGLYVMPADGGSTRLVVSTPDFKRQPEWVAP